MEKEEQNEKVVEQPKQEEQQKVRVEQVAQRMQVLQFNIKKMQTEYNQLYEVWFNAMQPKEEKEDGSDKK